MIQRYAALVFLVSGSLQAASLPRFFEPAGGSFDASSRGQFIEVSPNQVRIRAGSIAVPLTLRWRGAGNSAPTGEDPTGGVTRYLAGSNAARWRTAAPHYSRVRVRDLYPGVDLVYYFQEERLEFDAKGLSRNKVTDLDHVLRGRI